MLSFLAGVIAGALVGVAAAYWYAKRRRATLGRFLSFAAHELNSPLTAVTMTVSNLASGIFGSTPEQQKPWLESLREQVFRLGCLVAEMRDFVHMELRDDLCILYEEQSPNDIVEAAARSVQSGLAQAGVPFEVSLAQGLPAVNADPEKTARTLSSLIYHARKFRSTGPITLSARVDGRKVLFEVAFEAPEIPAAEAAHSLELYYPGQMDREMLKATGIGLGMLRALLEHQGGGLTLTCEKNRQVLTMALAAAPEK